MRGLQHLGMGAMRVHLSGMRALYSPLYSVAMRTLLHEMLLN